MAEKENTVKPRFSKKDFTDMLKANGDCLEWTGCSTADGYGRTQAYGKMWRTHRLALHLEDVDTTGHFVLHSCDNPLCCNPDHLRLGTHQENMDDMKSRGRQARHYGNHNGSAKLTEQQVLEIRAIRGMTRKEIAKRYGVGLTTINHIINRKRWQHI